MHHTVHGLKVWQTIVFRKGYSNTTFTSWRRCSRPVRPPHRKGVRTLRRGLPRPGIWHRRQKLPHGPASAWQGGVLPLAGSTPPHHAPAQDEGYDREANQHLQPRLPNRSQRDLGRSESLVGWTHSYIWLFKYNQGANAPPLYMYCKK
jgi:hypothetical protein